MHISTLKDSKYLSKGDVQPPILVTIRGLTQENLAMQGQPAEMKWILHFNEDVKPMVLNTTNIQIIAATVGSEETDDWLGKKIVLYNDPNISFQGRLVGGIRARAPRTTPQSRPSTPAPPTATRQTPTSPAPTQAPAPAPIEEEPASPFGADEEIPF